MAKFREMNLFGETLDSDQVGQLYGLLGTGVNALGTGLDSISNKYYRDNAGREDLADLVSGNSWGDVFNNRRKLSQGINTILSDSTDYSEVRNNDNLFNTWDGLQSGINDSFEWGGIGSAILSDAGKGLSMGAMTGNPLLTAGTTIVGALSGLGRGITSAIQHNNNVTKANRAINLANTNEVNNFNTTAQNNRARMQRKNLMNVFDVGGFLEGFNGVEHFNVGSSHEANPNGGIQQGIAPDGEPNLVEEGEIKYKDYIYSKRIKPSKSLLKKNNLPEKYAGLSYAEIADKLQKESEERPNDPISLSTLDSWMSRLQAAQEETKARKEARQAAKIFDSMSDEDKLGILAMMQNEEQPMMAEGGKIHIKESKKGTFTAAAKKHGKSVQEFASQVLSHPENYSPAMRKKANFARNAAKWHDLGGHLFDGDNPYGQKLNYKRGKALYTKGPDNTLIAIPNSQESLDYLTKRNYLLENWDSDDPNVKAFKDSYIKSINDYNKGRSGFIPYSLNNEDGHIQFTKDMFERGSSDGKVGAIHNGLVNLPLPTSEISEPVSNFVPITINIPDGDTSIVEDETLPAENPYMSWGKKDKKIETPPIKENYLRYAPIVGDFVNGIVSSFMGPDYTYANQLRRLAGEYRPIAAPTLGGYRRYTPYDINLGDAENIAMEAAALSANRGQNRATKTAADLATIHASQKADALRNLQWQQGNEANRANVDTYNLGIDKANLSTISSYDQMNQNIRDRKIRMLQAAAAAQDAADTLWSENISKSGTNFFNNLGNLGKDNWSANQRNIYLSQHPWMLPFFLNQ